MKWSSALLIILLLGLYVAALGRHGLLEPDEGRYAEMAREMLESGDLMIPTLNGIPHFQKPPVIYWSTAASLKLFGQNEIGARAAPLCAGLAILLLTYWIGKKWFGPVTGRISFWLLAAALEFFIISRGLCPDMVMAFWSTLAIAAFVWASHHSSPKRWRFAPFFICMGIAFATKGPMGILVPLFTAIGWQSSLHVRGMTRVRIPWLTGLLLTLCLAFSWFIACVSRYPELARYFLKYELLDRFFSSAHGRSQPFWFFAPVLLAGWLPWTPLFPLTLSDRRPAEDKRATTARHALLAWLLPALVILSLSGSKLFTYVLPLFPGIAIWLADTLSRMKTGRGLTISVLGQAAALLSFGVGVAAIAMHPAFLHVQFETDGWFLPLWLLATPAAAWAAWSLRRGVTEARVIRVSLASLVMWLLLMSQVVHMGPILGKQASLKPLADRIKRESDWEQSQIILAGRRMHGIEFYLSRLVDCTRLEADLQVKPTPDIERRLHDNVRSLRISKVGLPPCYVITQERELSDGAFPESEWKLLDREGSFVLLRFIESL